MTAELASSYSTISAKALLESVIPGYRIDSPQDCVFWERGANDTYRVQSESGIYFLRLYRHGAFPREANEFEADLLCHLNRNGFPVAYPIEHSSGGYIADIAAPEGIRYAMLSALAKGKELDYDSLATCQLAGESVASLHLTSNGFQSTFKRTNLDIGWLLDNSMSVIREHLRSRKSALQTVESIAKGTGEKLQSVPQDDMDFGICHGDLHGGNMHVHQNVITHFDFEECAFGYRVYDLATFKWGACRGQQKAQQWTAFIEGYRSLKTLSDTDLSLIDHFVILRELTETAYGIRHIKDFGHNGIMASEVDEVCERLTHFADIAD